jgi:hypothetical protein
MRPRKNEATRSRTHSGEPQGSLFLFSNFRSRRTSFYGEAGASPASLTAPRMVRIRSGCTAPRLTCFLWVPGTFLCMTHSGLTQEEPGTPAPGWSLSPLYTAWCVAPLPPLLPAIPSPPPTARGDPMFPRDGPYGPSFLRPLSTNQKSPTLIGDMTTRLTWREERYEQQSKTPHPSRLDHAQSDPSPLL